MNARGWPGPDADRSDDLRALARRARGLLPQLRPGSIGIGVAAVLLLILLLSTILTTDSDYYRYLKDAAGPGPAR